MEETYACGIKSYRPHRDLWEILGHDGTFAGREKIRRRLNDMANCSEDEKYALKALSDTYYYNLYERTGHNNQALYNAGFFPHEYDGNLKEYPSNRIYSSVLPKNKLFQNHKKAIDANPVQRMAVLFSTGGFAPIHDGHIEMMEAAKRQLESQGYHVLVGYFVLGHDSYVGKKYNGSVNIKTGDRITMAELAVQDSDWLEIDQFSARYLPCEVNFTFTFSLLKDVVLYTALKGYPIPELFYVYGSDNAGFGEVLPDNSIMIERSEISSKGVREGNHPAVKEYLDNIGKPSDNNLPYLIRSEWSEPLIMACLDQYIPDFEKRLAAFQSTLKLNIAQVFERHNSPRKVHVLQTSTQRSEAREVIGDQKTISLDPFFEGTYNVHLTRVFEQNGAQKKPLYRTTRPECYLVMDGTSVFRDFEHITPGEYVLVEDDSITGETVNMVKRMLPKDVIISSVVLLSDFGPHAGTEYYDIVDLRDFILGSKFGGLTCDIPFSSQQPISRQPYMAPFVNLRSRAKIPANAEMEISLIIWQANAKLFSNTNIPLYKMSQKIPFMSHLETIEAFCGYMVNMLLDLQ